ncbi:MAG: DMT family transporter [Dictyoglomaceae bacterium]|nr:DMT family transporter [Dictyoglomaceae bacterium]
MKEKISGLLSVILACIFWSLSFSVSKILLRQVSPFELAFTRFLLASIFSFIIFFPKVKNIPLKWDYQKPLFIAGLLGVTLYFIFENWGLKFTTASEGALLVGSFPAMGLLLEIFKEKEYPPKERILGLILSLFGVILILGSAGINFKIQNLFGNFLILLSGLSWVIYNWEIKRVNHIYPFEVLTTFQLIYGTFLFIPLLSFTGLRIPKGKEGFLGIFYLAFFCSALGYLLYNYGLKKMKVSQVVNILNLIPLFGALWGVIFLKEILGLIEILGGILIILGVSITTWK